MLVIPTHEFSKVPSHLHHQKQEVLSKTLKAVHADQTTSYGAI